ncbi:HIT family protein [Micrococcus sp. M4NT]|uniref:HIT family protein n=1 Tax=Micrococcus sp. M4NT TaxID=2957501 RepID=UPI0029B09475|nr:HIT family protein [Micrococcus sp. M4NT]MDX2341332.1 HIT family protein [Micrococcus sp. M4NT]
MTSVFTRIIAGELPARFVWQDEQCVAFLSAGPLAQGHTLVVPREEVDQWVDADPGLLAHLMQVAQRIGRAQVDAFGAQRAGLMVAGYEIPHLHVHVWPSNSMDDYDMARVDNSPEPKDLEEAARRIRDGLRSAGNSAAVPQD